MGRNTAATVLRDIGGGVPTNGGKTAIEASNPYVVTITIVGTADLLCHAWNSDSVEEKAAAAKGSKAKKTDDVESYVYRNDEGAICIPGRYLRGALVGAAKFRQDPRSPRKSAVDLFKAGIVSLTQLASLGSSDWDYLDKQRVVVNHGGINRTRPAFRAGWRAAFDVLVAIPEYISPEILRDVATNAGRLVGIGDFRPTYGRFAIDRFEIHEQ